MPEWSKGADLRSASASCVGSNPTPGIFFLILCFYVFYFNISNNLLCYKYIMDSKLLILIVLLIILIINNQKSSREEVDDPFRSYEDDLDNCGQNPINCVTGR